MGPMCIAAVFIFMIGYIGSISAYSNPRDCSVCGIRFPEHTARLLIRHGKPITDTKRFPWMVSLRPNSFSNECGGAILDEYFVLTAAHCVKSVDGEIYDDIKVYFQTESETQMSRGAAIEKIIIHPKYKTVQSKATDIVFAKYDIALLKLKRKIKCDMYKRPICLPSPDLKIPTGKANIIAGWGTTLPGTPGQSEVLRHGTLKHLDFEKCIKAVPETKMIRDHMLCLGETKQTVCYGDSGGPLVAKINSKYTVVGVASSETDATCPSSSPSIFTNVVKFLNWIKKEQRKASLQPIRFPQGREQTEQQRYPQKMYRERKYNLNKNRRLSCKESEGLQNARER